MANLLQNTSKRQLRMDFINDDRQLQYARYAVKRYRKCEPLETAVASNKRHIVNVDDTSRINYEMIKNAPGNLPAVSGTLSTVQDNEISGLKTKTYKSRLYELNDEYLERANAQLDHLKKQPKAKSVVPLESQQVWLEQIQENLLQEYKELVKDEKKWIVLKELLLDANVELDLYSAQDQGKKQVKLGSVAVPTHSNANALLFNRPKRPKVKNKGHHDNISPIV